MKNYTLNNGISIPTIGFGTYRLNEGEDARDAIIKAVETGYRLIDGAAAYGNEKGVGEGIRESGVSRDQLFITSKVWATDRGYDSTLRAFDKSISDLGLDYLDLYLIHWPASPAKESDWREINAETWRAMQSLLHEGRVRAIGVSNFMTIHLEALLATADTVPAVNQIEYNPGCRQTEIVDLCRRHNILIEAWSPLGRGRVFDNETLHTIADNHGKTVAQICLRWEMQNGMIPIPKSSNPDRMKQNLDIMDFSLTDEEMHLIDILPSYGQSGLHPETVAW